MTKTKIYILDLESLTACYGVLPLCLYEGKENAFVQVTEEWTAVSGFPQLGGVEHEAETNLIVEFCYRLSTRV